MYIYGKAEDGGGAERKKEDQRRVSQQCAAVAGHTYEY